MFDATAPCKTERDTGHVWLYMDQADDAIGVLEQKLATLQGVLVPVMMPANVVPGDDAPDAPMVPLAERISQLRNRILAAMAAVQDTIDRLEL